MDINTLKSLLSYDKEIGIFTWKVPRRNIRVGDVAGCVNAKGYRYIGVKEKLYRSNRLVWFYCYGEWPEFQVDHINGDRLDDRIENLRDVPAQGNQQNRRNGNKNSSSKMLGVSWNKLSSKWRAQISIGKTTRHIGMFDSEKDAHSAYMEAKKSIHRFNG